MPPHGNNPRANLPGYTALANALESATMTEMRELNNQMWATIVDGDGRACAAAFGGTNRGAQWLGSRVYRRSGEAAARAAECRNGPGTARVPGRHANPSDVFEQRHEPEVHVQLL